MGKERVLEATKKARTSGFIHIGEIIPGVLRDIERRIKGLTTSILEDASKNEEKNG